ncbi:ABC transporter permease subunit [Bacillus sp. JJ1122]|uniref:ABC transporter permease n=1 Tax=Bacillus sp. JJ1122 TaxID=3122951 RepID=UPI002FFD8E8D
MRKNWYLWLGICMFSVLLFFTLFGDRLSFVDPDPADSRMRFYEDGSMARAPFPPSLEDPLGTDNDGRDLLSLLIIGTKDTLRYIFWIALIRYIIAIPLAFLAASKRGLAYTIANAWNSLFSSVPTVFAAILLLMLPEPVWQFDVDIPYSMYWAILLLALTEVGRVSILVSHEINEIAEKEYVKAGIIIGVKPFKMFTNYYFPNIMQNLIINFCNDLGRITLLIGQLALFSIFIASKILILEGGMVDISSATYDWQALLEKSRSDVIKAIWIPLVPAIAITYTIFTFNLLGEGLRKIFNVYKTSNDPTYKDRLIQLFVIGISPFRKHKALIWSLVSIIVAAGGIILWSQLNEKETVKEVPIVDPVISAEKPVDISDTYEKKGEILVPITKSTTKMGGLYDDINFIKTTMPLKKFTPSPVFETDQIKLVCMNSDTKCREPVFYFPSPIKTEGEAMNAIKDHLPEDTKVQSTLEHNGDKIYNVSSEIFISSYPLESRGGMSITFKFDENKWIFAAAVRIGQKK